MRQETVSVDASQFCLRIGSDEDDEDADDESQSNEDPSETAVSINARMVTNGDDFEEDNSVSMKLDGASGKQEVCSAKQDTSKQEDVGVAREGEEAEGQVVSADQGDADQGASSGKSDQKSTEHLNGDVS